MEHKVLVEQINRHFEEEETANSVIREYSQAHSMTIRQDKELTVKDAEATMLHACMGLVTEAGELIDLLKKCWYGKKVPYTREQIKDEAGDLFWYYLLLLKSQGLNFEEVLSYNTEKLRKRYAK